MTEPLLTVVMSCYNQAGTVAQAVTADRCRLLSRVFRYAVSQSAGRQAECPNG